VQIFTTILGWSHSGGYLVLLRIVGVVWTGAASLVMRPPAAAVGHPSVESGARAV
jgi:hypothetical protein